ncbi:hypothetical protein V2J09_010934, partial [Rumex salicifolius]
KIQVLIPESDEEEPSVNIVDEVPQALAVVWSSPLVIKALGTRVPFAIMDIKLRELWKPRGRMRLIDLPNDYYLIEFDPEEVYFATLTGGPWLVFGHYVTIRQWCPNFDPLTDTIAMTLAWVICGPAICIELGLSKPLKGVVIVYSSRILVEYEGLNTICFKCGRFGHFQPNCAMQPKNIAVRKEHEKKERSGKWMTARQVMVPIALVGG